MVGVAGFEPATLSSQTRCASQTALHTDIIRKVVGVAGFEPATLSSQTRCASQTALHTDVLSEVVKVVRLFYFANKLFVKILKNQFFEANSARTL